MYRQPLDYKRNEEDDVVCVGVSGLLSKKKLRVPARRRPAGVKNPCDHNGPATAALSPGEPSSRRTKAMGDLNGLPYESNGIIMEGAVDAALTRPYEKLKVPVRRAQRSAALDYIRKEG